MTTEPAPRIVLTSIHVDDQARARAFYTDVLGFRLKHDLPLGEHRWLTVVSAQDPDGVELLLEPDDHPAARAYQAALTADGIPSGSFAVDDVRAVVAVLEARGVRVVQPPTEMGPVVTAVIDDTCGNLLQLTAPSALAPLTRGEGS